MHPLMSAKRLSDALVGILLLTALLMGGQAMEIKLKALLAPILIASAWEETLEHPQRVVKPWPWSDTWPVARLQVPAHGIDLPVLYGDSGNALAFAPGHAQASALLGRRGVAVVSAHRDTHFAFLAEAAVGEVVRVQLPQGNWRRYQIMSTRVADSRREFLSSESREEVLLLVTCYPFDAINAGGPLRYVVRAVAMEHPISEV
jgi:sortase A